MRVWSLTVACGLVLTPGWVAASDSLPKDVQSLIGDLDNQCRDSGGKPGKSPELLKIADLTGDGITDYVIDINGYDCEGAASALGAGQSGAGVSVFVGGPGNSAKSAYSGTTYGAKLDTAGGKARLYLDVAGLDCGQKNAAKLPFSNWTFCARPIDWMPAKRTFGFAPVKQARPVR